MTFEDAIREILRTYWNKSADFDALSTSQGPRKYNKKYFDSFAKTDSDEVAEKAEKVKK